VAEAPGLKQLLHVPAFCQIAWIASRMIEKEQVRTDDRIEDQVVLKTYFLAFQPGISFLAVIPNAKAADVWCMVLLATKTFSAPGRRSPSSTALKSQLWKRFSTTQIRCGAPNITTPYPQPVIVLFRISMFATG
jgi:hypothetical protein